MPAVPTHTYAGSLLLPAVLLPLDSDLFGEVDKQINLLLQMLAPHEEQLTFRSAVNTLLTHFVKTVTTGTPYTSVQLKCVDTSFEPINCFMPDDGFKRKFIASKQLNPNFMSLLYDRLLKLSTDRNQLFVYDNAAVTASITGDDDILELDGSREAGDVYGPQFMSMYQRMVLSDVLYVSNQSTAFEDKSSDDGKGDTDTVHFMINGLPVEISTQAGQELSMLAFLEEVSALVGKDCLFKRSLLLIRAWWSYETAAYIGCSMKNTLDEDTLGLLLCCIFNKYHIKLHTPFQALSVFLAEYGDVEWTGKIITLQGIFPVTLDHNTLYKLVQPQSAHLVDATMLQKYQTLNTTTSQTPPISGHLSRSRSDDRSHPSQHESHAKDVSKVGSSDRSLLSSAERETNARDSGKTGSSGNTDESPTPLVLLEDTPLTLAGLDLHMINILSPLTYKNTITNKLNPRKLKRIIKVFQIGVRNMVSTYEKVYI